MKKRTVKKRTISNVGKKYFSYEDIKITQFHRYYPSTLRLWIAGAHYYLSQVIRRHYLALTMKLNNFLEYGKWSACSHHKGWVDEGLWIECRRCGAKK